MSPDHFFVYGTLRSDCGAAHAVFMREHFTLIGTGTVAGRLYDIGDYPGLLPAKDAAERVRGEIHAFDDDAALIALDAYEGCAADSPTPHEYRRVKVSALLDDGRELEAWTYVFNFPVSEAMRIRSGDYARP